MVCTTKASHFAKNLLSFSSVHREIVVGETDKPIEHGVGLHSGASDVAIGEESVTFTDANGVMQSFAAKNTIVARGARGDLALAQALESAGFDVQTVGDANGISYVEGAMRGAAEAVRRIASAA